MTHRARPCRFERIDFLINNAGAGSPKPLHETDDETPARAGLPWTSLLAFQRISTHPRAAVNPLTPGQAWSYVAEWLAADATWVPHPGEMHAEILRRLVIDGDLRGNLVTDAHLAALAIEHGVGICSTDSDFARFPELMWINPVKS